MAVIRRDEPRIAAARAARQAEARAARIDRATREVNESVADVRRLHITDLPGQEMIYLRKEAEARAWLAADPEPEDLTAYPLLAAEIGVTGETPHQVATIWVWMAGALIDMAAALEPLRLGAIARIHADEDPEAVLADLAAALAALSNPT